MPRHRAVRRRLFQRRHDDLLQRSFRPCPACSEDVHVFSEVCRKCGHEIELVRA
ncbi:hypothetical protein [Saccharothrix hoggarensis]|uniref:Zinc ribbon protein n=1 Tax=Saccharothrix hoggarensis TaxID=913853 RepID=A0ABW3QVN7_9PSEU